MAVKQVTISAAGIVTVVSEDGHGLEKSLTINLAALAGGQGAHIVDAKVDYASPGLDTEAEIIAAFNTTNAKINSILAALEATGLLASS